VESSCEYGNEHSGSIKCWETTECPNNLGPLEWCSVRTLKDQSVLGARRIKGKGLSDC
jgi:hypothetical protein